MDANHLKQLIEEYAVDKAQVMCWYDNEWGFTNQMVREALQDLSLKEAPPGVATS